MTIQKTGILFIVSVLLLLNNGCIKDNLQAEFYLTDEIKNQNPYTTGDTIIFANSNGDTIISFVERHNNIIKAQLGINTNDYNLFEEDKTSIKADSLLIEMNMYYEPYQEPLVDFYVYYNGKDGSLYEFPIPFTNSNTPHELSIKIHDKWYYNVYYFEGSDISKLYYSTEYGILRIEFSDGIYLDYLDSW